MTCILLLYTTYRFNYPTVNSKSMAVLINTQYYTPKKAQAHEMHTYIYIFAYPQWSRKIVYIIKMLEYIVHTQYKHFLVYNVSAKLNQIL